MRAMAIAILLVLLGAARSVAEPALRCPEGTALRETPLASWCEIAPSGAAPLPHGPFVCRDATGQLRLEGSFAHGIPAGSWTGYSAAGARRFAGSFSASDAGPGTPPVPVQVAIEGFVTEGAGRHEGPGPHPKRACEAPLGHRGSGRSQDADGVFQLGPPFLIPPGVATGTWTVWNEGGEKTEEGVFDRGLRSGLWKIRHNGVPNELRYERGQMEGPYRNLDAAGNVIESGTYAAGRLEGKWVRVDGKRVTTCVYRAWRVVGACEVHRPDGSLAERVEYPDGRTPGTTTHFYPDGVMAWQDRYFAGGHETKQWFENGQLQLEGAWSSGRRHGLWRSFHADGTRHTEQAYANGKKDGMGTNWFSDGTTRASGAWTAGVPTGVHRTFWRGGLLASEIHYENGRTSKVETWYRSGTLRRTVDHVDGIRVERTYWRNGRLRTEHHYHGSHTVVGEVKVWHENGELSLVVPNENGQTHGVVRTFWPSGRVAGETHYQNGRKHGPERHWFENGQLETSGENANERPIGTWRSWHWDGSARIVMKYDGKGGLVIPYRKDQPPPDAEEKAHPSTASRGDLWRAGRRRLPFWKQGGCPLGSRAVEERTVGRLRSVGCVTPSGEQQGLWRGTWADGTPRFEGGYENGQEDGPWTRWHWNGQIHETYLVRSGRKQGPYREFFEDGSLRVESEYDDGHLVGTSTRWQWRKRRELERVEEYDRSGRLLRWSRYDEEGLLLETGESRPDGDGAIGNRYAGYPEGDVVETYEMRDGKPHGQAEEWSEEGFRSARGRYLEGLRDGTWILYGETGRPGSEVFYHRGKEKWRLPFL